MGTFYGLKPIDLAVIAGYFAAVMLIGFWAGRRVKNEADFFLGGRSFGKGLLVMHWLSTGTHSEQAVQLAGATARVGLGGIWYQWMYLFSTPFYWLIAPILRRLRVTTTGDFFRIRYGPSLEMLYSGVALGYIVLSIAMLLRGAAAAISGATGGMIPAQQTVILLCLLFSTYVVAGGLMAAAYTDVLQGMMIVVFSVLLVPAGLAAIGGAGSLHQKLDPAMFSLTAPLGAEEGDPWFVIAMSLLGLVGIGVQPHVMTATGSGKRELEARIGMCYGNFIKRFLTIAWAFTGLIALVQFPEVLRNLDLGSPEAAQASETLFGRAIQQFLGDGWRGLMIACLVAGVTSAETFMVTGSAVFTNNFYRRLAGDRRESHYLWVARLASAALLALGMLLALRAESLTQLLLVSIQLVGLLGGAFWLGVIWRRANSAGVWASFAGALLVWLSTQIPASTAASIPLLQWFQHTSHAFQILVMVGIEFGLLVLVSLKTRPLGESQLNSFFARLHTPVGKDTSTRPYQRPQQYGFEIPRMGWIDWGGFLAAWVLVGALIYLLRGARGVGG